MFGNREQNFEKVQYENILRECGTCEHRAILEGNKGTRTPPPLPWETLIILFPFIQGIKLHMKFARLHGITKGIETGMYLCNCLIPGVPRLLERGARGVVGLLLSKSCVLRPNHHAPCSIFRRGNAWGRGSICK